MPFPSGQHSSVTLPLHHSPLFLLPSIFVQLSVHSTITWDPFTGIQKKAFPVSVFILFELQAGVVSLISTVFTLVRSRSGVSPASRALLIIPLCIFIILFFAASFSIPIIIVISSWLRCSFLAFAFLVFSFSTQSCILLHTYPPPVAPKLIAQSCCRAAGCF